jgi:hypothetical protein
VRDGGVTWLGSPRPLVTPFVHGHVWLYAACSPCKDHLKTIVLRCKVFGFSVDESLVAVWQRSCGNLLATLLLDDLFGICDCGSVMYTVALMHVVLWLLPLFPCFLTGRVSV